MRELHEDFGDTLALVAAINTVTDAAREAHRLGCPYVGNATSAHCCTAAARVTQLAAAFTPPTSAGTVPTKGELSAARLCVRDAGVIMAAIRPRLRARFEAVERADLFERPPHYHHSWPPPTLAMLMEATERLTTLIASLSTVVALLADD